MKLKIISKFAANVSVEAEDKLLPTPDYDPEDEIWEFVPGTIVKGTLVKTDKGEKVLLATEKVEGDRGPIVQIWVRLLRPAEGGIKQIDAINWGNEIYKILPAPGYDPALEIWEFPPGTYVKCKQVKNREGKELPLANWDVG